MMKRISVAAVFLIVGIILVIIANTYFLTSQQVSVVPMAPVALDRTLASSHLAGALTFRTISDRRTPAAYAAQFNNMQTYLQRTFPRLHATLKRETVGQSLLYTWEGNDAQARPVLWLAHQDVVPIAPGTEGDWRHPPFGGMVADGYIWGRGSWDDKASIVAQMEAIEHLLASGFRPRATIYLAYGADEETGGEGGAAVMAQLLKARGIHFDYILDEGLLVTHGMMIGTSKPVALIGVAEKGFASVRLQVSVPPGHSSIPPTVTAIGALSDALVKLERSQMPAEINGVARQMFHTLAPELHGTSRVMLSNLWLFAPLVKWQLQSSDGANAMLRTTTALTMTSAGNKDNVLPGHADAVVNFRVRPGDSLADVMSHVRRATYSDRVRAELDAGASEPSRISSMLSPQYSLINTTIREIFQDAIVAPGLVVGGTDARHYDALSENIYRFSPVRADIEDLSRLHGTNERLGEDDYLDAIRFYIQLAKNGQGSI